MRGAAAIAGSVRGRVQLEGRRVEREPVVGARDAERLAEPARAGAEEALVLEPAARAHRVEPVRRLERAHEDRRGDALLARRRG